MLPENSLPTRSVIKEKCAELAVEHKFNQGNCNGWKCENEQERGEQGHPTEHRHPHHGHSRTAHVDNGRDKVEGRQQGGKTKYLKTHHPEIRADAHVSKGFL